MNLLMNSMKVFLLYITVTCLSLPLVAGEYNGPSLGGQTVSISGPWLTADEKNFEAVISYFEKATGAKVDYAGSDSFEQQIIGGNMVVS